MFDPIHLARLLIFCCMVTMVYIRIPTVYGIHIAGHHAYVLATGYSIHAGLRILSSLNLRTLELLSSLTKKRIRNRTRHADTATS